MLKKNPKKLNAMQFIKFLSSWTFWSLKMCLNYFLEGSSDSESSFLGRWFLIFTGLCMMKGLLICITCFLNTFVTHCSVDGGNGKVSTWVHYAFLEISLWKTYLFFLLSSLISYGNFPCPFISLFIFPWGLISITE